MTTIFEIEQIGLWWLPDKPDHRVYGTLHLSRDDNGTLELIGGAFGDITSTLQAGPQIIIHGISSDGTYFTLNDCSRIGTRVNALPSEFYQIGVIYEGYLFSDESELVFDEIKVHYSNLEDWLKEEGFAFNFSQDPETHKTSQLETVCTFPTKEALSFPNFDLQFSYQYGAKRTLREASLTFSQIAHFKYPDFRSINEIDADVVRLRDFISFGLGRSSHLISFTLFSSRLAETIELDEQKHVIPIPIIVHLPSMISPESVKFIHPDAMLFSWKDISDRFGEIYNLWINRYNILKPTVHSYFTALESPSEYSIDRFLSLTTAVESYHRRTHPGMFLLEEDFKSVEATMKEAIPSHLSSSMKDSIAGRIHYFNEVSQRNRYKELIETFLSEFGEDSLVLLEDSKIFIERVLDTRNYYTHFDKRLENKAATGQDLIVLIEKLLFVLDLAFMREIGFSVDQVITLLKRTSKYDFLKNYRKWNPDHNFP